MAYAYDKGYTKGTGDGTTFSPNDPVTSEMFMTFVLRALGYSDSTDTPDFSYGSSVAFAEKVRLSSGSYVSGEGLLRGDLAVISETALSLTVQGGGGGSLIQTLVDKEAVTPAAARGAGVTVSAPPAPATVVLPLSFDGGSSQPKIDLMKLATALPGAAKLTWVGISQW